MKLISLSQFPSLLLTPLLVVAPVWAQAPAAPDAESLQLRLVESDSGQIQAGFHAVKGFTVEVKDSAGNVVPDAAVVFRLPDSGPTGTFADHTHAAVSYTDSLGCAHAGGIQWSAIPGLVPVRISATKGTSHAGMLIEQALLSSSANVGPVAPAAKITVSPQQPGALANPATALSQVPPKEPVVTVTGAPPHSASHSSKTKWFVIAAIAVGAGLGVAMATKGKGGNPTSTASGPTVGPGTISVGQ